MGVLVVVNVSEFCVQFLMASSDQHNPWFFCITFLVLKVTICRQKGNNFVLNMKNKFDCRPQ